MSNSSTLSYAISDLVAVAKSRLDILEKQIQAGNEVDIHTRAGQAKGIVLAVRRFDDVLALIEQPYLGIVVKKANELKAKNPKDKEAIKLLQNLVPIEEDGETEKD